MLHINQKQLLPMDFSSIHVEHKTYTGYGEWLEGGYVLMRRNHNQHFLFCQQIEHIICMQH